MGVVVVRGGQERPPATLGARARSRPQEAFHNYNITHSYLYLGDRAGEGHGPMVSVLQE
jgi:hypothetical protein